MKDKNHRTGKKIQANIFLILGLRMWEDKSDTIRTEHANSSKNTINRMRTENSNLEKIFAVHHMIY